MGAGGLLGDAEAAWAQYLSESWRSQTWESLPEEDRDYGQRYLGAHLDNAAAPDAALYALVDERWMRAWYALENAYTGFLGDVDRAWKRADKGATDQTRGAAEEGTAHLTLQLRCALCHSSVVGMSARVSPELLASALRTQVWSESQALAIVKKAPRSWSKDELWDVLVRALPSALYSAVLREVRELDSPGDRVQALVAALPSLAPDLAARACSEAISAAMLLEEQGERGRALRQVVELAPHHAARQVLILLESDARGLKVRDFDREPILECLAMTVPPEMVPRVSRLVDSLGMESRSRPLLVLASRVPDSERDALLAAAVEAIREERNLGTRCKMLAKIAGAAVPGFGAAVDEALRAVEESSGQSRLEAIEALGAQHWSGPWAARLMRAAVTRAAVTRAENYWSIRAVVALFDGLEADAREEALAAIRAARAEERGEGLATLATRSSGTLQDGLWDEALAAVEQVLHEAATRGAVHPSDGLGDYSSAHLLDRLIAGVPPERLPAVARLVRALEGPALRAPRLAALAARSGTEDRKQLAAEALDTLQAMDAGSPRADIAAEVVKELPEANRRGAIEIGLAAIEKAGDSPYFHRLLPYLSGGHVQAALEAAGRLQEPSAIASAIVALTERFPDVVQSAVAIARTLPVAHERARALAAFVRLLPVEDAVALTREAVAASEEIGDAQAVAALRNTIAAEVTTSRAWERDGEAEPAVELPLLSLEQAERELQAVSAIADGTAWLSAVMELLPQLPAQLRADPARNAWFYAQEAMGSHLQRSMVARTMAWLLLYLPDSMQDTGRRDVFELVAAVHDLRERAWAAIDVAQVLAEDERTELLKPILGISPFLAHEDDVADIFARTAPLLPATLLPAAADAAFAIQNEVLLARAVGPIASRAAHLAAGAPIAAHECWQRILHGHAGRPRPSLVNALPSLTPLAAQLAPRNTKLVDALADELETVARWWP